jgi:plasmid maintenance system antidote protein VapI
MLMTDRGVTSKALAETLGIQESTLANFRHGYRGIPSDIVSGMARELGTNVPFLLERSEDARPIAVIIEDARRSEEAHRLRVSRADSEV